MLYVYGIDIYMYILIWPCRQSETDDVVLVDTLTGQKGLYTVDAVAARIVVVIW